MKGNKILYPIFSVLLAVLLAFSSIGVSINIHRCNGNIYSVGFYTNAPVCEMEHNFDEELSHLDGTCNPSAIKNISAQSCCDQTQIYELLDISSQNSQTDYSFEFIDFLTIQQFPQVILQEFSNRKVFPFRSPPKRTMNRSVLYECFII